MGSAARLRHRADDPGELAAGAAGRDRKKFIAAGWEVSENNQRVRVYRLTAAGKKQLAAEQSWWAKFSRAIASMAERPIGESDR
jgi:PadR family transcriptional regulator PadR